MASHTDNPDAKKKHIEHSAYRCTPNKEGEAPHIDPILSQTKAKNNLYRPISGVIFMLGRQFPVIQPIFFHLDAEIVHRTG
jgi:hypothetical protein